jgi:hypothetical protein
MCAKKSFINNFLWENEHKHHGVLIAMPGMAAANEDPKVNTLSLFCMWGND